MQTRKVKFQPFHAFGYIEYSQFQKLKHLLINCIYVILISMYDNYVPLYSVIVALHLLCTNPDDITSKTNIIVLNFMA